jgi:hypothetical protein
MNRSKSVRQVRFTDLLGLSDRRASRRNIRRMASKLLPFNSGRRRKISSRAASLAVVWSVKRFAIWQSCHAPH